MENKERPREMGDHSNRLKELSLSYFFFSLLVQWFVFCWSANQVHLSHWLLTGSTFSANKGQVVPTVQEARATDDHWRHYIGQQLTVS